MRDALTTNRIKALVGIDCGEEPCRDRRDDPPYRQGRLAYAENVPACDCPFEIGDNARARWYAGWYDAKYAALWPQWFGGET